MVCENDVGGWRKQKNKRKRPKSKGAQNEGTKPAKAMVLVCIKQSTRTEAENDGMRRCIIEKSTCLYVEKKLTFQ